MPVIVDPDQVLPDKTKSIRPSQIMLWLLFPVVLAIGFSIGLVVGIKQGQNSATTNNANRQQVNSSIVPNANTRVTTNTTNANTNVSNAFTNLSNSSLSNADYLKITATTQAQLDAQQQHDIDTLVDQTATVTDIVRQRDLISLKYALKAYASVEGKYPSTNGTMVRIEGKADEIMYQTLKQFYGGSFNLKIDPESPTYYYGYASDGSSFTLTAYLVSKKKTFTLTDGG
jgi:hypothetical protein